MILDLISQSVLEEVLANAEDDMPNKIREKEESLQNTLQKRYSIPMMSLGNNKTNTVAKSYDGYADYSDKKVTYTAEPAIKSPSEENSNVDSTYQWEVSSIDFRNILEGEEKPINVKEHMIVNMKQKDINDFNDYRGLHESTDIGNQKAEPIYEEHVVIEEKDEEIQFAEPVKPFEQAKPEIGKYGIPANIEKVLSSTFDFDNTMVAIHQTREEYKNVTEKANIATQAANESEELLQKVSSEYSEAEKQLKEKEKRSQEMEKKIISILNSEKNRINKEMQEKETLINNATRRKEQNDDKIVDFQSKINSAKEKENEIDEKISRQEELLNTLVGFSMDFEDYKLEDKEKISGKVA